MKQTGFSTYPAARVARLYVLIRGFFHWAAYRIQPLLKRRSRSG